MPNRNRGLDVSPLFGRELKQPEEGWATSDTLTHTPGWIQSGWKRSRSTLCPPFKGWYHSRAEMFSPPRCSQSDADCCPACLWGLLFAHQLCTV